MHDIEKHKHFKDRYSFEAAIGFDWLGVSEIPDMRYPMPEPKPQKSEDGSQEKEKKA